jgi:hypothetical protein
MKFSISWQDKWWYQVSTHMSITDLAVVSFTCLLVDKMPRASRRIKRNGEHLYLLSYISMLCPGYYMNYEVYLEFLLFEPHVGLY